MTEGDLRLAAAYLLHRARRSQSTRRNVAFTQALAHQHHSMRTVSAIYPECSSNPATRTFRFSVMQRDPLAHSSLPGFIWAQRRDYFPGLAFAISRIVVITPLPLIPQCRPRGRGPGRANRRTRQFREARRKRELFQLAAHRAEPRVSVVAGVADPGEGPASPRPATIAPARGSSR
jgi:hypothetical protein